MRILVLKPFKAFLHRRNNRLMKKIRLLLFAICLFTIFLVLGCQGVFTFSPFGFAADDPAKMPRAQLLTYSWDVIASGDKAKMTAALNATVAMATANPTDGDLWYVAGNLALTLSNAARLFTHQIEIFINHPASVVAFKSTIDQSMLMAASGMYLNAGMNGVTLNPVDYIFASIGLLLATPHTLTDMEGLSFFPYTVPPPPWGTPDVVGWPDGNILARSLMDMGINALGGYTDSNYWWQSIVGCFFGPPL
jgi:hypothetical protein